MPELLPSIPHRDDAGRIAIPCQIVDPPADQMVFSFRPSFSDTIPYPDRTGNVSAGNVVS